MPHAEEGRRDVVCVLSEGQVLRVGLLPRQIEPLLGDPSTSRLELIAVAAAYDPPA